MTPLVGIVIAVITALLAPNRRGLVISVLTLMAAATAVQSWDLGSGRGSNPPDTIDHVSYWVVQAIIITIITAVALGIYRLRVRRAARSGRPLARPATSGRRGISLLAAGTLAMTALLVAAEIVVSHLTTNHGHGAGRIPWTGVLGIVVGVLAIAGLAVAHARGSRAQREVPAELRSR